MDGNRIHNQRPAWTKNHVPVSKCIRNLEGFCCISRTDCIERQSVGSFLIQRHAGMLVFYVVVYIRNQLLNRGLQAARIFYLSHNLP
jgi:hypothetical protein